MTQAEKHGKRASLMGGLYLADGVTLARDAIEKNGVSEATFRARLKRGVSVDDATKPVEKRPRPLSLSPVTGLGAGQSLADGLRLGLGDDLEIPEILRAARAMRALESALLAQSHQRELAQRADEKMAVAIAKRDAAQAELARLEAQPKKASASVAERSRFSRARAALQAQCEIAEREIAAALLANALAEEEAEKAGALLPLARAAVQPFAAWIVASGRNRLLSNYLTA